jgi:hypothetical protein
MPRFFFHLRNDLTVDDSEGKELPDSKAAHAQAERYATEMAAFSLVEHGRINLQHRIEVTNEAGQNVAIVKFGDVVGIEG